MRTALVSLLLLATAMAGCSGGKGSADDGPVTCPDGRVVEPSDGHMHDENLSEEEHELMADPCFVAPSVEVEGLATSLAAYVTDPFQWTVQNGSIPSGHSMLTSLRYATEAADPASLADAASWGTELTKKEHNNLPVTIDGTIRFDVPGTYYVRVYAQVRGEGFPDHDYWSQEFVLNVTPVAETGVTHAVVHAEGAHVSDQIPVGAFDTAEVDAALGDALTIENKHVQDLVLELSGACPVADLTVAAQTTSAAIVLTEPGLCTVRTTEVAPQEIAVRVAAPA